MMMLWLWNLFIFLVLHVCVFEEVFPAVRSYTQLLEFFHRKSKVLWRKQTREINKNKEVLFTQWACKPSGHLRCDKNRFVAVLHRIRFPSQGIEARPREGDLVCGEI